MSRPRFYVPPGTLNGPEAFLGDQLAHRIVRVLRLAPGDRVYLFDGTGLEVEAVITDVARHQVRARVLAAYRPHTEPKAQVVLHQALIASDRFEWVLEKGTELGVAGFAPLICARNTVRLPTNRRSLERKLQRWRAVVTAAAEQSHRTVPPIVTSPVTFAQALARTGDRAVVAWERSKSPASSLLPTLLFRDQRPITLLVGPEGGLTDEEAAAAEEAGAALVSLGPRVLRAETAAVVMAALILYHLGELSPSRPASPA